MKRTVSILLVALLLLVAVPTFAEGEVALQPGLYVSDSGTDVLYLNEKGGGVLNFTVDGQYYANGVTWDDGSLEIERVKTPYTLQGDMLIFTYEDAVRILRYAGEGEAYAMGDGTGTAFAGTYLADDGRQLTLAADGQGVYTGANGETPVLWGSLVPYWKGLDNLNDGTCYVLFDSYLTGMTVAEEDITLTTETEGDVILHRQQAAQPADEGQLYYGYRMTTDGQTTDLVPFLTAMGLDPKDIFLELRADGTGTLQFMDDRAEITWTEDTLTYEGESIPYTRQGDHILLSIEDEALELAPAAEMEALLSDKGQKTAATVTPAAQEMVGTWTFTKARAMGFEIPASSMGTTMTLKLAADGTATLTSDDDPVDMEWSVQEDGNLVLSTGGIEIFTLIYDGASLTLVTESDSVEMVFEKEN